MPADDWEQSDARTLSAGTMMARLGTCMYGTLTSACDQTYIKLGSYGLPTLQFVLDLMGALSRKHQMDLQQINVV